MKLTVILLLTALHLSASISAQKITYSGQSLSLQKIFSVIEKQTDYVFFYDKKDLKNAKPVTVNFNQASLVTVLQEILKGQQLDFEIQGNTIAITHKEKSLNVTEENTLPPPIDVKGKVTNEKGEPFEGATVRVKGSRIATSTNANGEFTLKGIGENAVLVFSGISLNTEEVRVNRQTYISVRLTTKITKLENITVVANTGFQSIPKERATGSFGIIDKEQLDKPTINIAQRLIGTTAGMQAKLDENGNPTFQIRGLSSLYGQKQPLVVVDGFPVQGDFNTINPNDVESATVLKDAAAASIWGARSANGVIVITTKSAKKGMPLKIEFDAFTRMGKKFDLDYVRPLAPSDQTVEYEKLAYANWRSFPNPGTLFTNYAFSQAGTALNEYNSGFITAAERDARLEKLKTLDNRQQISNYLLSNPVNTQYNLGISGSTARMSNSFSFMYEDNKSNFKKTTDKRYMFNFRNSSEVFKWMSFNFSGMVQASNADNSGVYLFDIRGMSPYDMLINEDGSYTNINRYYWPFMERSVPMNRFPYADWTYNPVQEIANRKLTSDRLNTRFQAGLNFKIIKGLSFDTKGQVELFNSNDRELYNENTYSVRSRINHATTWNRAANTFVPNLPKGSILVQGRSKTRSYNWRNQLNYNNLFGRDHEVNLIAGAEISNSVSEGFGYPNTYGYNDNTLSAGIFPNGPGGTFYLIKDWMGYTQNFSYTNSFSSGTTRYFSIFSNMAYTYKTKYTLSGSYRTDASNMISEDPKYRFAPFLSAGLGWQVYKEDFMKNVKWVDRLNLRATFGYNGNVDRSTAFRPLIALDGTQNIYTGDFTAIVSSFGNPTLRWERTRTSNWAIDYSLFKGKLFGKVDLYNKYGKDLLATLSIPSINGTTFQKLNNAEMSNKGVELELGSSLNISRKLSWYGSLNFSYNKNRIQKLFVERYSPYDLLIAGSTSSYMVGYDASSFWLFKYAGLVNGFPSVVGEKGKTYSFADFFPGDGRTFMVNTGPTVAPYTLGFSSGFRYGNLALSFILTGKFGHKFKRMGFNYPPTQTGRVLPNVKLSEVMNGDPSKIAPLPLNTNESSYYIWQYSSYDDYLLENASHVKMQELALNYALPARLLKKINLSRLQLYAQSNDLFTIYANKAKEDPEYPLGTMKPQPKLTLGIKLEL